MTTRNCLILLTLAFASRGALPVEALRLNAMPAEATPFKTTASRAMPSKAMPSRATDDVLHHGTWTKKGYAVGGSWSIVEKAGEHWIVLSADFKTRRAPDLKLFLSPLVPKEVGNRNATSGSVLIAPLEKHSGSQRYRIPPGVDLSSYATVAIHCEQFSKLWAVAALGSDKK